jgi:hypothetical protein
VADLEDARRIALSLPDTLEYGDETGTGFSVRAGARNKGVAWVWNERVEPKRPRVPNPSVLAVRVANVHEKEALLALGRRELFTEPHYNGFPAVLVRLAEIEVEELEDLIVEAWRCQAPKRLVKAWDAEQAAS